MTEPSVRVNPVTGRTVVLAPGRSERPRDPDPAEPSGPPVARDPSCPFCPGNEGELPEILEEWPDAGKDTSGWAVRAAPNRYPAFRPPRAPDASGTSDPRDRSLRARDGGNPTSETPALGAQEIVIESPRHDEDLATMTPEGVGRVLTAWRARYRSLAGLPWVEHVLLFRNRGRAAGASLDHPHSQLVALPRVPPDARRRKERLRAHHRERGECLLCADPAGTPPGSYDPSASLEIARNAAARAVVPWAPETRCEVWVVPERHEADFGRSGDAELRDVAALLRRACGAVWAVLGEIDYNVLLHAGGRGADREAEHWFLQLRPRHSQLAGFELASGLRLSDADPPEDARRLREALET